MALDSNNEGARKLALSVLSKVKVPSILTTIVDGLVENRNTDTWRVVSKNLEYISDVDKYKEFTSQVFLSRRKARIWGRRRLSVLKDILVGTDRVKVHFLGSGMPSFWTVVKDGVELTIGLSGWTSNDWASKAKFSSFIPTTNVKEELIPAALDLIKKEGGVTTAVLAKALSISTGDASVLLQKLCLQGKAMYDPDRNLYRWRDLFPTLDLYIDDDSSREMRGALKELKDFNISKTLDDVKEGVRYLSGLIKYGNEEFKPMLELDLDNRPKYAQCSCSFYNFNKLRQGPCRHMIALLLVGDSA